MKCFVISQGGKVIVHAELTDSEGFKEAHFKIRNQWLQYSPDGEKWIRYSDPVKLLTL